MRIYNVQIQPDGDVKVETDLSPMDMQILLTMGMYACMERGVMISSLAPFFEKINQLQKEDVKQEPVQQTLDWEATLEGNVNANKS